MVVLSAAVCDKNGKAIVARQFINMSKLRAESLLAAFPKLLSSEAGKQHTYIESENVRYVYQPVEDIFMLLVTNKNSNIVQDLDTLKLMGKLVPETTGHISEEAIGEHAFELLFAFDEVVTQGGHREDVTLAQVRQNVEMESHEEKLAMMIEQSKMQVAKGESKRKAAAIRQAKREESRRLRALGGDASTPGAGNAPYGGLGSNSYGGVGSDSLTSGPSYGVGSETTHGAYNSAAPISSTAPDIPEEVHRAKPSGMKLRTRSQPSDQSNIAAMMAEEGIPASAATPGSDRAQDAAAVVSAAATAAAAAAADNVTTELEEKLTVTMTRDGAAEVQARGTLTLACQQPDATKIRVLLDRGNTSKFQFQNHPNTDKRAFVQDGTIALKNPDKGFPVGAAVSVLRWRSNNLNEADAPLLINPWPEELGDGTVAVNIEYTLMKRDMHLQNVVISLPNGNSAQEPDVQQCDGQWRYNPQARTVEWRIESISSENASGTFEFQVAADDADLFFPVQVTFDSQDTLCPLSVKDIVSDETGKQMRFSASKKLVVQSYLVE